MSSEAVNVIVKAIQNSEFRTQLFRDPDTALRDFRLTSEEIEGFKSLDERRYDEALAEMGVELQRRIQQGGINLGDSRLKYTDYPVIVVED
jgi:hypothetical protein